LIAIACLSPSALFGQLNVITSGGFAAAYQELIPAFETRSGISVKTTRGASQGDGPNTIPAQLRRGLAADIVIMSKEGLSELISGGKIVPGSAVDLAQARLGVGVRAGAPKPDISTVEGFKQMVLRAKFINIVSTTAIYMTEKLFPKLGITADIAGKIKGSTVGEVASGEVEITIRPVSEILTVPGVDFVGPVPAEIQFVSVFTAAIVAGSKHTEAAKQLITFLASEDAKPAIRKSGMQPARSH